MRKATTTGETPLRLVQVGLGGWGRNWYTTRIRGSRDAQVVAFVDQSEQALKALQADDGVRAAMCFTSLREALEEVAADAVLVTASLPGHVPAAKEALAAGKHVLMEKPFAPSVAEARALAKEAERLGLLLMISQNYRYFPAPQHAARIVQTGELGSLGVVDVEFRRNHVEFDAGRKTHFDLANPLLADMAIHHFDLMRLVIGADATRIRCHSFNPPWSHFREDPAAEAVIEFDRGVTVTYRGSWVSQEPQTGWAGEWRLEFERGLLRFTSRSDETGRKDRLWIRTAGARERPIRLETMDATDRSGSLREFVTSIREGRSMREGLTPATSGVGNIGSIGLTYAAIEASESGAWISVAR